MDTELIKTFLEIVEHKSFIRAAEHLNIAQTTVGARVRTLERRLGQRLFVRDKGGVSLTPAGEQLLQHAPNFLQLWQRIQRQVAAPNGDTSFLTIGGEINLWQPIVLDWSSAIRKSRPDIKLRVHLDLRQDLINHVAAGAIDAAVMYAPTLRSGLNVDLLLDEKLVLATTDPDADPFDDTKFVSTDWGAGFMDEFGIRFPDAQAPDLSTNLGPLALQYILKNGGSGYFRWRTIEPYIASGHLHLIPSAPQVSYPVHVVTSAESDESLLASVLACLKQAVAEYP